MFNGNKNRWRKEERDFDKDSKYVKVITEYNNRDIIYRNRPNRCVLTLF